MKTYFVILISSVLLFSCMPKAPEQPAQKTPPMVGGGGMKMPKDDAHGQMGGGDADVSGNKIPGGLDLDAMFAKLPAGWTRQAPSSQMRSAQASLSATSGDSEPAEMVIFYFPGTGGSADANISRWQGQYTGPKGEPGKDVAKTASETINGLKVTTTDITGTMLASAMMTSGGEATDKPNYRLIASVVETPSGNWFIKVNGPKATVTAREGEIRKFLQGVRLNSGESS